MVILHNKCTYQEASRQAGVARNGALVMVFRSRRARLSAPGEISNEETSALKYQTSSRNISRANGGGSRRGSWK